MSGPGFMSNAAIEQARIGRLRAEQDAEDDRNRAVRAAQKDTEPPPVDEDAAAEARAYERGRADHLADVLAFMREGEAKANKLADETDAIDEPLKYACRATVAETLNATAEGLEKRAADRLATKQGAVSSRPSAVSWLDAWGVAVAAHWPSSQPPALEMLRRLARDLPYTPPEQLRVPARRAWAVYLDEGETDMGRAAVALTYAIAAEQKRVARG